jgi:hypothetical protein
MYEGRSMRQNSYVLALFPPPGGWRLLGGDGYEKHQKDPC